MLSPLALGFPGSLAGKESACNAGGLGSTPGLGRSPAEGSGSPLQHAGLESPTDAVAPGLAWDGARLSHPLLALMAGCVAQCPPISLLSALSSVHLFFLPIFGLVKRSFLPFPSPPTGPIVT